EDPAQTASPGWCRRSCRQRSCRAARLERFSPVLRHRCSPLVAAAGSVPACWPLLVLMPPCRKTGRAMSALFRPRAGSVPLARDNRARRWRWKDGAVTADLIGRVKDGDENAFRQLIDPYQAELQLHCYRILGSAQDAQDALQETLLAAWRGLPQFEGRSSIRTWLYRIATNSCLKALRSASRRPPVDLPPLPWQDTPEPNGEGEVFWLQPYPDMMLDGLADSAPGPEARYEAAEAISLAFVAALQALPPRQRAVLILRDVLGFSTSQVADILESSEDAAASALKRARATMRDRFPAATESQPPPRPDSPEERDLVVRFTRAYQAGDVAAVVALLTEDVAVTMPPQAVEFHGRELVARF